MMSTGYKMMFCPHCYSAKVTRTLNPGHSNFKRIRICRFCNSELLISELARLTPEEAREKRREWMRENRGYLKMREAIRD